MTTTAINAERTGAPATLKPLPDQPESWIAHEKPIPFDQAAEKILSAHRQDGTRDDTLVHDLRTWAFGTADQEHMALARVPLPGRDTGKPLPLREQAFGQLCQKIGAPAPYVRQLPVKLQVACMNWGLSRHQGNALLRLAGDEVRAIVSERYAALDDELVLDLVEKTLDRAGYIKDALVRATATGPHTLMRITLPNEARPVKKGDLIEHGIDIANSELGLRSVQVTPVTFRLLCENGLRAWRSEASLRMRHIGDPDRLKDQLSDAIPVAFAEARGDVDRWARAVDLLVDSALDEIESLRGFGLSTGEVQAIGRTFAAEQNLLPAGTGAQTLGEVLNTQATVFDLANAITSAARERDTAGRLSLEETAHRYLTRKAA
jgi:hypothetical protein